MKPRHWIREELRAEVVAIWRAGNDFTMREIGRAVGVTEAQVRYAVRDLPKTRLQHQRSELARRNGTK